VRHRSTGQTRPQDLGSVCRRPRGQGAARTRVRHLMRSRLRYFAAVLPGPAARIRLLTCGAKGTRTPDPLLANNRQHVHPRPSPQVTVPERVSASLQIRTCCGTSVLYSPPRPTALRRPCETPPLPLAGIHTSRGESKWIPRRQGSHGGPGRATYFDLPLPPRMVCRCYRVDGDVVRHGGCGRGPQDDRCGWVLSQRLWVGGESADG
jgi:hypothetical protein